MYLNSLAPAHGKEMQTTSYRNGDDAAILDLFETVFDRPMSAEWWRWRFKENPVDRPRIRLAWDGGRLVSHYAVSPFLLWINGKIELAALSMTTMTHPNYGGQGLFPRLASELYSELSTDNFACVLGFPNRNSHVGFVSKLGWSDIFTQHCLERTFSAVEKGIAPSEGAVTTDASSGFGSMALPRDVTAWYYDDALLRWRLCQKSGNEYRFTTIRTKQGEVAARALWKFYGDCAADIVHIVANDGDSLRRLIGSIGHEAARGETITLKTWVTLWDPMHVWLERAGFVPALPIAYFGGRALRPGFKLPNSQTWRLSMMSSDLF